MTLGPDDLPPPDSQHSRLYCHCTSDLFGCFIKDRQATLKCSRCGATVVVLEAIDQGSAVDPQRDTLPQPAVNVGLGDAGQATSQLAVPVPPVRNGAVLRGGDADGMDVPVLADVSDFIYGRPGGGFAALSTGAAWSEDVRDKMNIGQVYRDSGERDHRGIRIFDLAR